MCCQVLVGADVQQYVLCLVSHSDRCLCCWCELCLVSGYGWLFAIVRHCISLLQYQISVTPLNELQQSGILKGAVHWHIKGLYSFARSGIRSPQSLMCVVLRNNKGSTDFQSLLLCPSNVQITRPKSASCSSNSTDTTQTLFDLTAR